ncbi:hypothetical protein Tco_0138058 [Tanacetum coccineum]
MSDSEDSTVTYTEVSSLFEDRSDIGSPGVDGLPMMLEDPYAYVEAALQAPPSPDYVPSPEEPEQAPIFLEYVSEPEYPEYLVPSEDEAPLEDQPLNMDASPAALSPGYVANFDPEDEDQDDDSKEDHADYPVDGGDDDDDDDDDSDEDESFEDEDEEELEHLASADSALPAIDPVLSAGDTKAFKTGESAVTPPPPPAYRTTSRLSVRPQTPIPFPSKAEVDKLIALPTPPPSPLSPWSSPLPQIPSPPLSLPSPPPTSPTYTEAPLGYRVAGLRVRASSPPLLLPSTAQREESLEADLPLRKRLSMTAPTGRFKIRESSTATAAMHVEPTLARDDLYRFDDTIDAAPGRSMSREVGYGITQGCQNRDLDLRIILPQELSRVHSTFHVSNLKKCLSDEPLAIPLEEIHIDDKLNFVEEPVEILDREIKWLKKSRIPIIKVRWNSRRGPEFTWEREDQFRKKYPHLFTQTTPSSSATS